AAVPLLVVALDADNHLVQDYTGTVHFTSSDGAATLPADFTFAAADHGFHLFSVTFGTTGGQTVTATDTVHAAITGSAHVTVFAPDRKSVVEGDAVPIPPHGAA